MIFFLGKIFDAVVGRHTKPKYDGLIRLPLDDVSNAVSHLRGRDMAEKFNYFVDLIQKAPMDGWDTERQKRLSAPLMSLAKSIEDYSGDGVVYFKHEDLAEIQKYDPYFMEAERCYEKSAKLMTNIMFFNEAIRMEKEEKFIISPKRIAQEIHDFRFKFHELVKDMPPLPERESGYNIVSVGMPRPNRH